MPSILTGGLLNPPGGLLTGGLGAGSFTVPTVAAGRDWTLADAIIAQLRDTHEFSAVVEGEDPGVTGGALAADYSYAAAVDVTGWEEADDAMDADGTPRQIRKVLGTVTVLGVGQYRSEVKRNLDRLSSLVQNTVDGSSLGGMALPALTKCRRGRYQDKDSGEVRLTLAWEATYFVAGYAGHDTSEA